VGEKKTGSLRVSSDRGLKLEFHAAAVARHARYVAFQMAEIAMPPSPLRNDSTSLRRIGSLCPVPSWRRARPWPSEVPNQGSKGMLWGHPVTLQMRRQLRHRMGDKP